MTKKVSSYSDCEGGIHLHVGGREGYLKKKGASHDNQSCAGGKKETPVHKKNPRVGLNGSQRTSKKKESPT